MSRGSCPQRVLLHAFSTFKLGGPQARFVQLANAMGTDYRHIIVAMDNCFDAGERLNPEVQWEPLRLDVVKGGTLANRWAFRTVLQRLKPDLLLSYNWGAIEWAAANLPATVPHLHVEDGFGPDETHCQLPRRVWMGALTFMTAMTAGAAVAWAGFSLPLLESWITLSVLAFGLITLFSRRGQAEGITQATLTAIGLFAFCHGQAHAIEALGDVPTYLGGFLLATALLHLAGIGLARGLAERSMAQRLMGAGIAASGLYLLVG